MSEKKKLVPKRRFKEFENADPWEQQKVESLFKITRGYVLAADKTSLRKTKTMKYPVYSSQTLNNGLLGYYNEFLFEKAITWTTDGANAGTVCYRNEKFYSTNVNGVLISKVGYSCKAVAESLNRVAWKHVTKVGNPKLMNNTMSNIILMVPIDFEELDKISKFFTYTDNLITLHQRAHLTIYYKGVVKWLIKLEKPTYLLIIILNGLKFIKKALLEKLRCQNIE